MQEMAFLLASKEDSASGPPEQLPLPDGARGIRGEAGVEVGQRLVVASVFAECSLQ